VKIWSQDEKDAQDTKKLEKLNAVKANMPDNPVVDDVFKRGMLEFAGVTPEKVNEAMEYEDQKRMALMNASMNPMSPMVPGQSTAPAGGTLPFSQPTT
jgi:hypothetical protein